MEPLPVEHYPLSPSKASVTPSKQIGYEKEVCGRLWLGCGFFQVGGLDSMIQPALFMMISRNSQNAY
jgi:hypothetical protein